MKYSDHRREILSDFREQYGKFRFTKSVSRDEMEKLEGFISENLKKIAGVCFDAAEEGMEGLCRKEDVRACQKEFIDTK